MHWIDELPNHAHWPELMNKRQLVDGRIIYSVVCGRCSSDRGDYARCVWVDGFPENVVAFNEPLL